MKKRPETFKFRLSNVERRAIADLAIRLQRSESDAVRFVVIEAMKQLMQVDSALPDEDSKQMPEESHVTP